MRRRSTVLTDLRHHLACAPVHEQIPYSFAWPHQFGPRMAQNESDYHVPSKTAKNKNLLPRAIANIDKHLRTALPAETWHAYLMPLLFIKWLSDDWLAKRAALAQRFPAQPSLIARHLAEQALTLPLLQLPRVIHEPFGQPEYCLASFDSLLSRCAQPEIGSYIDQVLSALEQANLSSLQGIFRHLSYHKVHYPHHSAHRHSLWRNVLVELAKFDFSGNDARQSFDDMWQQLLQAQLGPVAASQQFLVGQLLPQLWPAAQQASFADPFCGNGQLLQQLRGQFGSGFGQEADSALLAHARMTDLLTQLTQPLAKVRESICWREGNSLQQPALGKHGLRLFDRQASNLCRLALSWDKKALRNDAFRRFRFGLTPTDKPELLCLCHMLATATPATGKIAVMLPVGCLYRTGNEQKMRRHLLLEAGIDAVILLPGKPGDVQQMALLLCDMARCTATPSDVLMIDARHLGDYLTQDGTASNEAITAEIATLYKHRQTRLGRVALATYAEIAAQGDSWLPSTYLASAIRQYEQDAALLTAEIADLEQRCKNMQEDLLLELVKLQDTST